MRDGALPVRDPDLNDKNVINQKLESEFDVSRDHNEPDRAAGSSGAPPLDHSEGAVSDVCIDPTEVDLVAADAAAGFASGPLDDALGESQCEQFFEASFDALDPGTQRRSFMRELDELELQAGALLRRLKLAPSSSLLPSMPGRTVVVRNTFLCVVEETGADHVSAVRRAASAPPCLVRDSTCACASVRSAPPGLRRPQASKVLAVQVLPPFSAERTSLLLGKGAASATPPCTRRTQNTGCDEGLNTCSDSCYEHMSFENIVIPSVASEVVRGDSFVSSGFLAYALLMCFGGDFGVKSGCDVSKADLISAAAIEEAPIESFDGPVADDDLVAKKEHLDEDKARWGQARPAAPARNVQTSAVWFAGTHCGGVCGIPS